MIITDLGADALIVIDGLDAITLLGLADPATLDPTDFILGP